MKYTIKLSNGQEAKYWQDISGLYFAEIRDEFNLVESCCIERTVSAVHKWISEYDK